MAATRKSAKRTKKRAGKGASGRKRSGTTSAAKRRSKSSAKKAGGSKKRANRSPRSPLKTVRAAGEKTWEALKSTTAQVVEGVKGTFGVDESSNGR